MSLKKGKCEREVRPAVESWASLHPLRGVFHDILDPESILRQRECVIRAELDSHRFVPNPLFVHDVDGVT
jgi:hypothetical protein